MPKKTKGWSAERRRKQAENIRATRPWAHSTGAKTPAGKAASSQNATKHGLYAADVLELRALLRRQARFVLAIRPDLA